MKKRTMKFLYYSGIVVLYLLMVDGEYQNDLSDCVVSNFHKKEPWFGEELIFSAYVLENNVVNIKITYEHLDETDFFTTFYFSPSIKFSKRIETKDGEDHYLQLTAMEKANDWVEFKIASQHGTIEVSYEPEIYEQFSINQTSYTFKDLSIRASNISFCKEGRAWEIFEGNHQTIPLGRDTMNNSFLLRFHPQYDIDPVISIFNTNERLSYHAYKLVVERNKVTLKSLKDQGEEIDFELSHHLTTIDISNEGEKFYVTVDLEANAQLPPNMIMTVKPVGPEPEESCPNCNNYMAGFISILSILIIITIIIGLGFKTKIFHITFRNFKFPKETQGQSNGNVNSRAEAHPLTTQDHTSSA